MNKAYIDGVEVSLEFIGLYHDVVAKLNIGAELTQREVEFCVFMDKFFRERLKDEKERKKN